MLYRLEKPQPDELKQSGRSSALQTGQGRDEDSEFHQEDTYYNGTNRGDLSLGTSTVENKLQYGTVRK